MRASAPTQGDGTPRPSSTRHACRPRLCRPFALHCRAGDFARRGGLRRGDAAVLCKRRTAEFCNAAGPGKSAAPRKGIGKARCGTPQSADADITGLRCPHRAACAKAHLRSATAAPAPSRCIRRRRRSTPQPLAGEALGAAPARSQIPVSPVCKLCYNKGQTPKQGDAGRARAGVRTWGRPAHGRAAQKIASKFSNKENLP